MSGFQQQPFVSIGTLAKQRRMEELSAAAAAGNNASSFFPDEGIVCPRCGHKVYHAERMTISGLSYHKACFTCRLCRVHLDSLNANQKDSQLYCRKCYGRAFGPRGYGFGSGAGTLSMTMTALQDPNLNSVVHKPGPGFAWDSFDDADGSNGQQFENPLNRQYVKTYAHDHIVTSNVPSVGEARAFPLLAAAGDCRNERAGKSKLGLGAVQGLPPNVISLTPVPHTSYMRHASEGVPSRQTRNNDVAFAADNSRTRSATPRPPRRLLDEPEAFLRRRGERFHY